MSKKIVIASLVIAVIALGMSVYSVAALQYKEEQKTRDVQFVMYLGTNDKDTNEPVYPPDEAKARAADILIKHFGGYTIQEATGGWADNGTFYNEYTLVIYLSDTTLEEVHAAADDMIRDFNQSSILIQTNESATEFYSAEK